jgi:UDP-N-acetylglucosamine:LPS N-acetylglucosamine transferase
LLGFGGIAYQGTAPLPQLPGVAWLVADTWPTHSRKDVIPFSQARMPYPDLLASSDALVTKVGYGSFVEAARLGLPVLYLDRPDWPETPWLAPWLARHARAMAIDEQTLFSPLVGEALAGLWQRPSPQRPDTSGAPVVARRILDLLMG